MYLLDTDVLIDIQRGYEPAVQWFSNINQMPSVPGFVVMELIQDAENGRQIEQAMQLVAPFPVVWPDSEDCNRALTYFHQYHLSHRLGLLDTLIGCCAIGLNATLYSFNVKHYRTIPDLCLEQPYQRIC